jgi:hypothetical protein
MSEQDRSGTRSATVDSPTSSRETGASESASASSSVPSDRAEPSTETTLAADRDSFDTVVRDDLVEAGESAFSRAQGSQSKSPPRFAAKTPEKKRIKAPPSGNWL